MTRSLAGGAALPRRTVPRLRRSAADAIESLLFLTAIAIVGAASTATLFAAGFAFLMPATVAPSPEALHAVAAPPLPAKIAPSKVAPAHPETAAKTAFAGTAKTPPGAETKTPVSAVSASPGVAASPVLAPIRSFAEAGVAIAHGDASFDDGEVSVARFYFERAVDAGDAEAAVRMGETFDPAFLTEGRARRERGDIAAARFWYRRAIEEGAADARERLDYLDTEVAVVRARKEPQRNVYHRRGMAVRQYERPDNPPGATFHQILEHILHPPPRS